MCIIPRIGLFSRGKAVLTASIAVSYKKQARNRKISPRDLSLIDDSPTRFSWPDSARKNLPVQSLQAMCSVGTYGGPIKVLHSMHDRKNCPTVETRTTLVGIRLISSYTNIGAYLHIFRAFQTHNHPSKSPYAARISNRAD